MTFENENDFEKTFENESCSVMSSSLWPHRLYSPWNSPGQNTGIGSHSLLQGILPTQRSNQGLPHWRHSLPADLPGKPVFKLLSCCFLCMCLIQVSTGKGWGVICQVLLLPNRILGSIVLKNHSKHVYIQQMLLKWNILCTSLTT